VVSPTSNRNYLAGSRQQVEVRERAGPRERRLSMLGHRSRIIECHHWVDAYKVIYQDNELKTFLQTGGDDLVDLDSPGWLP